MPNPNPTGAINWTTLLQIWQLLQQLFAGSGAKQQMKSSVGDPAKAAGVECCCTCAEHALAILQCCCEDLEKAGVQVPPNVQQQLQAAGFTPKP